MGYRGMLALALAILAAGCDALVATSSGPPPAPVAADERRFVWTARPGASAYTVTISLDRAGTSAVAASGFTSDTSLPMSALAWRESHPLPDRAYFWVVRAFDRPDPQGLLLALSEPREFRPWSWEAQAWRVDGPR